MTHARLNIYTGGLTFIVIVLALLNWNVVSETATAGIAAVVTMLFIWGVVGVKTKLDPRIILGATERKFFNAAVILAGLLLAFSLSAKLAGNIFDIDATLITRARNVFSGFVLLYFANMMPKMIGPVLTGKCSNTAANSVRGVDATHAFPGAGRMVPEIQCVDGNFFVRNKSIQGNRDGTFVRRLSFVIYRISVHIRFHR